MEIQVVKKIELKKSSLVRRRDRLINLWAQMPVVLRLIAAVAVAGTIVAVTLGYWRLRNNQDFILKGEEPRLTMEVRAVVNGYERRVTDGDKLQLLVRADKETIFADERHELENVIVENYPADSAAPDRVSAAKAVYQPDSVNPENFAIDFSGNVNFETRDHYRIKTERIRYDKQLETAETAAAINFSRDNISGSAVGAKINIKEKHLDLLSQVEIIATPNGNLAKNSLTDFGTSNVKINAARGSFDQALDKFELNENVNILIEPQNAENLPTIIRAQKAVYQKDLQKLDLSGGVEIVSASDNLLAGGQPNQNNNPPANSQAPLTIRAEAASHEQASGKVFLNGKASVEQNNQLMSGERIVAELSRQRKLQHVVTTGEAFLRTVSVERTTEVKAAEMNFQFDQNQQIQFANASGAVQVQSASGGNVIDLNDAATLRLDFKLARDKSLLEKMRTSGTTNVNLTTINSVDYSSAQMFAPDWTEVLFAQQNDQSVLKQMTTGGRTTIVMSAPRSQANNPKATNKKIVADSLKLIWHEAEQSLSKAEAVGNAELYIFPVATGENLDKNSLFARRFDCDFYETGNLAKTFVASGKARAIIEPTLPTAERAERNLSADKMIANFERAAQAVESFNAAGNAKFNELERNAVAHNFNYTALDGVVRLRGGEPLLWDNRARFKAQEIDWDTRRKTSNLRGKVQTTYYSQEQTGGATPFAKVDSPVFLSSNSAVFDHVAGTAHYTGEARAWQDSNFIRADKLILQRETKSMSGEGAINSALYNIKRRVDDVETIIPVFARSERMNYSDAQKMLQYTNNVDIRQGTDRIVSEVAEVYLNAANQVDKTLVQKNVVITQPGKKAVGDWAQYNAVDETVILRGNPARVEDAAQGASSGRQLTMFLRENRIEGTGGAVSTAPGRVRSTHKINKQ